MRAPRVHALDAVGAGFATLLTVATLVTLGSACGGAETGGARAEGESALVCPHDAVLARRTCHCAPGLSVLDGACVGPRELDAYCGAPSVGGACPTLACAGTDALDLGTRACTPASVARAVVARSRPVPDDLALGCRDGRALVLSGDDVTCLPPDALCPRDAFWNESGLHCATASACAPGEIRSEGGGCTRILQGESGGSAVVDVGRWSREMLGTDGGDASVRLCRPLGEHIAELDVGPGGARTLTVEIRLSFPNNDVTQVDAQVETLDGASRQPIVGGGAVPAQKAVEALLVPLRALGGVSDAASTALRVQCAVRGGSSPFLFPKDAP